MKLLRFGEPGKEKPGIMIDETIFDVSSFGEDFGETFFGSDGIKRLSQWLASNQSSLPKVNASVRFGSPFTRPSKIICVGLNYSDHAKETGAALPAEPIIFFKSTTALTGPNDPLVIPQKSEK